MCMKITMQAKVKAGLFLASIQFFKPNTIFWEAISESIHHLTGKKLPGVMNRKIKKSRQKQWKTDELENGQVKTAKADTTAWKSTPANNWWLPVPCSTVTVSEWEGENLLSVLLCRWGTSTTGTLFYKILLAYTFKIEAFLYILFVLFLILNWTHFFWSKKQ